MRQVGPRISGLTQGLPPLSWPPTLEPSPPKPVPFWVLWEKQLQKDSSEHSFVAGVDKYFPISFLWSLSALPLIGKRYTHQAGNHIYDSKFLAPRALQLLVTAEEPIIASPIGQKNFERTKLTPRCGIRGLLDELTELDWLSLSWDPTQFPNQKQYPLRREAQEGLKPLINKFLACGLLVPTNSACNISILPVKKKEGIWCVVQDLQIINEAVVPLHPSLPDSYVILGEISHNFKWFTLLDLKDTFFCTPLAEKYFLPSSGRLQEKNANKWPGQYYLRDSINSPHLIGQALSWDLLDLNLGPNRNKTNTLYSLEHIINNTASQTTTT